MTDQWWPQILDHVLFMEDCMMCAYYRCLGGEKYQKCRLVNVVMGVNKPKFEILSQCVNSFWYHVKYP